MSTINLDYFLTHTEIDSIYKKDAENNYVIPYKYNTESQAKLQEKITLVRNNPIIIKSIPGKPGVINTDKFDRIYVNSDIHSDYRNFINFLKNLNLIAIPYGLNIYTDPANPATRNDIYDPRFIIETKWLATNTLYIITGDLVDGRRGSFAVDDPRGSFDILLHMFIYNLRLKALEMNSDILFTIGNHDSITAINHDSFPIYEKLKKGWSLYGPELSDDMKIFFLEDGIEDDNIIDEKNMKALNDRRDSLTMFYSLSPYLFIEIENSGGNKIFLIHSSLMFDDEIHPWPTERKSGLADLKKYQEHIEQTAINNNFILSNIPGEPTECLTILECGKNNTMVNVFGILSSLDHNNKYKYDYKALCTDYASYFPNCTLIVGHCKTLYNDTYDNSFVKNITKNKTDVTDEYEDCDEQNKAGCIIPKCFNDNFKLIMVDTGFSRPNRIKHITEDKIPSGTKAERRNYRSTYGSDGSKRVSEILKIKRGGKSKYDFGTQLSPFELYYKVRWNPYRHIQISEISVLADVSTTTNPRTSGIADYYHRRPQWIEINQDSEKNPEIRDKFNKNPNSSVNANIYGGGISSNMYKEKYLKYKKKYLDYKNKISK